MTLNVNAVFADSKGHWEGVQWIEAEMHRRAAAPGQISLADMM